MSNTTHDHPEARPTASDDPRRAEARRYVQQLHAFRVHATVFAGSMIAIVLVNLLVNLTAGIAGDWRAWWSLWALLGWSIGVAVHGLAVRMARSRIAASARQERQVEQVLADIGAESSP